MKLYVVHMRRWGTEESHSYVLGVFSLPDLAIQAGVDEYKYRGGFGKYEPEVIEVTLNGTRETRKQLGIGIGWAKKQLNEIDNEAE